MFRMKLSPVTQCNAPSFKSTISPQFTCKNTSQSTQDQKNQIQSTILYQWLRNLIIKQVINTQHELWERKFHCIKKIRERLQPIALVLRSLSLIKIFPPKLQLFHLMPYSPWLNLAIIFGAVALSSSLYPWGMSQYL